MKKQIIYLPIAILAVLLTACSTPKKDIAGLNEEIEAAYKGHYGQAQRHEEMAEENQKVAEHVLKHWQDDQYWNIDEKQKALDAAHQAAQHRLESEKEFCMWLSEVHPQFKHESHMHEHEHHHSAAYFQTGSAIPHKTDDAAIYHIGSFLQAHPEATALVTASTDTVGNASSNQALSEARAEAVKRMLLAHGAKPQQINTKAIGKAHGPDKTANQENRVATIVINIPPSQIHQINCSSLK